LTFETGSKLTEIEERAFTDCPELPLLPIPASVKIISGLAFTNTGIATIAVDEGNADFEFIDDFLMNVTDNTAVRYFTSETDIELNGEIEVIGVGCFAQNDTLLSVTFEPMSRVNRIETEAFQCCTDLTEICIPASVEIIGESCFDYCEVLSSLTFERGSKLREIGVCAFCCCPLKSVSIPASVESLGDECFAGCDELSSFTFESGSKLLRIGLRVFAGSKLLESIVIPRSIKELVKDWACGSSLWEVTFESAASLQKMIDQDAVDLSEGFSIKIEGCDSDIDYLGSSIAHRFKNFAHLI
jgi:hypothetical protein